MNVKEVVLHVSTKKNTSQLNLRRESCHASQSKWTSIILIRNTVCDNFILSDDSILPDILAEGSDSSETLEDDAGIMETIVGEALGAL